MIVLKFGGSSVDSPEKIKTIEEIVRNELPRNPIVVVSALRGITDELITFARQSYDENPAANSTFNRIRLKHYNLDSALGLGLFMPEEYNALLHASSHREISFLQYLDSIQSYGEILSSKILSTYLRSRGINTTQFNAYDLGLQTNSDFTKAEYIPESLQEIKRIVSSLDTIPIVTGFIAKDVYGNPTTLGRNGSDYSAAIFANALDAEELQIWTDVDGVLAADPKIVEDAKPIKELSFREASELAYFGAKVIHPKALKPARAKNIPVRVLNTLNPYNEGTLIRDREVNDGVKAIANRNDITILNIESVGMLGAYGFLAKIFEIFDRYKKSVDVIATSEVSVSCTIDEPENLDSIIQDLEKFGTIRVHQGKCLICVVGDGIRYTSGVAGRTFGVLGRNNINVEMISHGASSSNLTFLISGNLESKVVRLLHKEFIDN